MAKIMVFQHVPYEPLGTLDPLLRAYKHRIRYVNFGRKPSAKPSIEGYDALIILGGPMNIGQEPVYPHLNYEKQVILDAIERGIPVLGICLGAQLIASALNAKVYSADEKEVGWYPMSLTEDGKKDPVLKHIKTTMDIFQWHGFTFDLPEGAVRLVEGHKCVNQAFRFGDNVYGFQFHLEASLRLIQRWLHLPQHQEELGLGKAKAQIEKIWNDTLYRMDDSLILSQQVFSSFLRLIPGVNRQHQFLHRHFG